MQLQTPCNTSPCVSVKLEMWSIALTFFFSFDSTHLYMEPRTLLNDANTAHCIEKSALCFSIFPGVFSQ